MYLCSSRLVYFRCRVVFAGYCIGELQCYCDFVVMFDIFYRPGILGRWWISNACYITRTNQKLMWSLPVKIKILSLTKVSFYMESLWEIITEKVTNSWDIFSWELSHSVRKDFSFNSKTPENLRYLLFWLLVLCLPNVFFSISY